MKIRALLILLLACVADAGAQTTFDWSIDFSTVFDNREGEHVYARPETVFFTHLRPLVGLSLSSSDRFAGGVEWIEPVGYDWDGRRVRPVLFYRHESERWSGSLGVFPRRQLFEELPSFMWCDSTAYFQPDIRGALLQWRCGRSFAEIYIDWRQKQTERRRESFTVVAHGRWQDSQRPWLAGAYATMNHLALTKHAPEDMYILDNMLFAPYVGADFSGATALDSLRVRLGAAVTVERHRADRIWHAPGGAWLELIAGYKGFRVKNMLYAGGHLLPSYGIFGSELYQGEPYYAAKFYDRAEVSYALIRKPWGDLRAELDFNFTPDNFMFYQKVTLTLRFSQSHPLKSRK